MDWRDFIASIVDSLAWPAAVVVLAVLMRRHVADLLARVSRLKVSPSSLELEWPEAIARTKVSSARALDVSLEDDEPELGHLDGLAERNPAEAIRQAFGIVIGELRRLASDRNVEMLVDSDNPQILIKSCYGAGVITKETGEALRGLLTLRDLAERDPERVTVERAVDFILLARAVLYALSRPPPVAPGRTGAHP